MILLIGAGCAVTTTDAVVSTANESARRNSASAQGQRPAAAVPEADPSPTPQITDLGGWQDLPRHATSAVVVPVGIEIVAPRSAATESVPAPAPSRAQLGFPESQTEDAPVAAPTPALTATPVASASTSGVDVAPSTQAPSTQRTPSEDRAQIVAVARSDVDFVPVHRSPGGSPYDLKYEFLDGSLTDYPLVNPTYFGGPLTLAVVTGSESDDWLEVQLPVRPTGSTAWVKASLFDLQVSDWYVEIDVGTNQVRAWNGDELVIESTAVSGRSSRPTPVLSTYIDDKVRGPNSAYGPWMLTLAAFSESLNRFGGGIPKLAIHGTDSPALMGQYASSGCVRVPNSVIEELAALVPVGTRVDIVSSR